MMANGNFELVAEDDRSNTNEYLRKMDSPSLLRESLARRADFSQGREMAEGEIVLPALTFFKLYSGLV